MTFDEWYEKNCIKDSPGKGMYATHEGDWIYKEDCKEIWDSIMAELAAPLPKPAVDALTTGAGADSSMTFGEWFSENCPEYQRQSYSAADMESNVRGMAYEAWNFSHPASEPKGEGK